MLLSIILVAGLVGLDQLFKWLAVQHLMPVGVLPGLPPVFQFRYVENNGAAFNLLAGRQGILIAVTGLALLAIAYLLLFRRPADRLEYSAFVLVLAGGIGNLIDRIANGYVVDYIDLLFMNFPVFNLADICVCVGFGLLVLALVLQELRRKKAAKAEGSHD